MDEGTPRLPHESRPGIGKTTVAGRLLHLPQEAGGPVGGFTTANLRSGGVLAVVATVQLAPLERERAARFPGAKGRVPSRRAQGILWDHLDPAKVAAIPALAARAAGRPDR